jgi:hypothetical protein
MSVIIPSKEHIEYITNLAKKWAILSAPPSTGSAMLIEPQQKVDIQSSSIQY